MIRTEAAPEAGVRYTHRPGAYAILMLDGRVLVTFQKRPREELQLPGGGIDPGEGAVRALHREVYEETGYRIKSPRRLGAHRRFVWMPDYRMYAEKVCHIYLARPTLRISAPIEPEHEAIWMEAEEAVRRLSIPGDARFLKALLG
ncbi:NUDIX domain-containing protein [Palleronia sp.]|uniref:NUDIX domain-containing protein n=1 Tax=Palleronia sp. TaxID=1940284 RepID=UPI0035C7F808